MCREPSKSSLLTKHFILLAPLEKDLLAIDLLIAATNNTTYTTSNLLPLSLFTMPCSNEKKEFTEEDITDLAGYVILVTGGKPSASSCASPCTIARTNMM